MYIRNNETPPVLHKRITLARVRYYDAIVVGIRKSPTIHNNNVLFEVLNNIIIYNYAWSTNIMSKDIKPPSIVRRISETQGVGWTHNLILSIFDYTHNLLL